MQKVRAKFKCESIEDFKVYKVASFHAVVDDKGENKGFSTATPSGQFKMYITSDAPASSFFEPSEEYYLDFTKA